jgi:hypothetical protein
MEVCGINVSEITAEQAQQIINAEKQRKKEKFVKLYNALCKEMGLVLVARVIITPDGRLQAVIDDIAEL